MDDKKPAPPSGKIVCECGTLKPDSKSECPSCTRISTGIFVAVVLVLTALSFSVLLAYGKP